MKPDEIARRLTSVQRFAVLLAGANQASPIPGKLWLQKEMFLLSKSIPELWPDLGYEPALLGPFSDALEWAAEQLESVGLLKADESGFHLTVTGAECWDLLRKQTDDRTLARVSEMKELLNDLSKDEMLVFVYFNYPEMASESEEIGRLRPKRIDLALRLFAKGKVGLEKGAKVAGLDVRGFAALLRRRGTALHTE